MDGNYPMSYRTSSPLSPLPKKATQTKDGPQWELVKVGMASEKEDMMKEDIKSSKGLRGSCEDF